MTEGTIKDIAEVSTTADGRIVSIIFKIEDRDDPVTLYFQTEFLGAILLQMAGILKFAESRSSLAIQGVQSFQEPSESRANITDDGRDVVLSFRMPSGLEYHFALPTSHAKEFGKKIAANAEETKTKRGSLIIG